MTELYVLVSILSKKALLTIFWQKYSLWRIVAQCIFGKI